jgi:Domain of unknown function (DUF4194)
MSVTHTPTGHNDQGSFRLDDQRAGGGRLSDRAEEDDVDDGLGEGPEDDDGVDSWFLTDSEEQDQDDATSLACFEGDTGRMDYQQRRALHALLKNRYISQERHPDQWATLLLHQDRIRSRLNDLFLDLYIDRVHQVAFKRQAVSETGAALPTLLHEVAHSKEETILLVSLRTRFFRQRRDGDSIVYVERSTLLEDVAEMRPEHATDRSSDQRKTDRAVEGLRKAGVLLKTPDPDRFRISPVIEVLMPMPKLHALLAWLREQNGTTARPDGTRDNEPGVSAAADLGEDQTR